MTEPQKELEPVAPEAFDVDRPRAEEPIGYRDAAPEIPERFVHARPPQSRATSARPTVWLACAVVLILGGLFAVCAKGRRDLDRRHAPNATGAPP